MFSEGIGYTVGGVLWVWVLNTLRGLPADAIYQPFVYLGLAIGIGFVFWGVFLIAKGLYMRGRRPRVTRTRPDRRRAKLGF